MNITHLNTHQLGPDRAFEALCNQLFERWVRATYPGQVTYFQTVNGAGGDGGVEAYAELRSGEVVGVQAKWFVGSFQDKQIKQIRKSVVTAKQVRPSLRRYVVCIPRELQSQRRGKGGKITLNVEGQRFQNLEKELTALYPDLIIERWDAHRLLEQLQVPGNEGIQRFWFEKEELSLPALQHTFQVAEAGWLRERYSPELHQQGLIEQAIAAMLFTPAHRQQLVAGVTQQVTRVQLAIQLLASYQLLAAPSPALATQLEELHAYWQSLEQRLKGIKAAFERGQDQPSLPPLPAAPAGLALAEALEQAMVPTTLRNVKPPLLTVVATLTGPSVERELAKLLQANAPHNLLVLGRPGTGKTHALAKAAAEHLRAGQPAVIIRAKSTPGIDWPTILRSALGGLLAWSAEEIWTGLEALAVRADSYRALARQASGQLEPEEPTKVLLCVDGVEEAANPEEWKTRVAELRALLPAYPRLRVVISSRSYPPANPDPVGFTNDEQLCKLELPITGDVPVVELAPVYLREYGIRYEQLPWLPTAFQDALSLRLFAEKYRDQDLSRQSAPLKLTLSALLADKVNQVEAAFKREQLPVSASESLAQRGLLRVADALDTVGELPHEELSQQVVTDLHGLVTRAQAGRMLELYAEFGLLLQVKSTPDADDFLAETQITYTFPFQPLVDYFLSLRATRQQLTSKSPDLPELLRRRADPNARELTATALLLDHHILVGENGYWTGQVSEYQLRVLQYRALGNAPEATVRQYLPLVIANFERSAYDRNLVLQEFVLPTLHRPQLEVVAAVVHATLLAFSSVFARDVFWASPTPFTPALPGRPARHISTLLQAYALSDWQPAGGLPLLLGWSLATADNAYREHARRELARWGYRNPPELLKLLGLLFFVGDDQVQEDLTLVLLGVASQFMVAGTGLRPLATWLLTHVFAADCIVRIRSSVVRAAGRAVVELAYRLGDCTEEEVDSARPPYALGEDTLLPLELGGPSGRRGERFPIVHDLAWYVLEKSYRGFLDTGSRLTTASEALLRRYRQATQEEAINPGHFAMSAALAYIKSLGYDRLPSEGASMTRDSHGALSKEGTLEEKYTWLAVHQLQGYLADRLPYERNSERYQRLPDYQLLVSLLNPAAEPPAATPPEWYLPVDISPALDAGDAPVAQALEAWVNRKDLPDFTTWLRLPGLQPGPVAEASAAWCPLYLDTHLSEPTNTGATTLELSCCLVPEAEWEDFQAYFLRHAPYLQRRLFADAGQLQARPAGPTYTSVQNVVKLGWLEEEESTEEFEYAEDAAFTLHKTVVKVTEHTLADGEQHPVAPAKLLREGLGIGQTDGTAFRNAQGQRVAHYQAIHEEDYDRQQLLVVDRAAFEAWCADNHFKPFWIVCQYQSTSLNEKARSEGLHFTNFRYWLVWEDAGGIQQHLYHDDQYRDKQPVPAGDGDEEEEEDDVR